MKVDKFEGMKFVDTKAEFSDGRKLYVAMIQGKFTRRNVLEKLENLAEKLRGQSKNAYLGVSAHYDYPNDWLPAIYRRADQQQVLYNPSDSDTTTGYKNIDGLYFYITELPDGSDLGQKMHKVKRSNQKVDNLFLNHQKK